MISQEKSCGFLLGPFCKCFAEEGLHAFAAPLMRAFMNGVFDPVFCVKQTIGSQGDIQLFSDIGKAAFP